MRPGPGRRRSLHDWKIGEPAGRPGRGALRPVRLAVVRHATVRIRSISGGWLRQVGPVGPSGLLPGPLLAQPRALVPAPVVPTVGVNQRVEYPGGQSLE